MVKLLGVLIASFVFTGILSVPFINLLYKLKFQRQDESKAKDAFNEKMPVFSKLHAHKVGTPNGGGILVIVAVFIFSVLFYSFTKFSANWTTYILLLTLGSFGILGFYDDIHKIFGWKKTGIWGLQLRYKFLLQWFLAFGMGYLLYAKMGLHGIAIPLPGGSWFLDLGAWFIPFAAFVIVATTNAFNITDGLDGLSTGLLLIALSAFWVLASFANFGDIILFIAVLVGSLLAFLYFNIYPARIMMGDTGAMALGALLAVVALMINQAAVLPIIGGVFVIEAASTLIQWTSKAIRKKKVFLCAPLHHHFEAIGWDETKVTMRFWLAGAVLAFIGLFVALLPTLRL